MERVLGLVISALAVGGGIGGLVRPEIYRSSMEDSYTPAAARIGGLVLLALGLAGLWAILAYGVGPGEFFPA